MLHEGAVDEDVAAADATQEDAVCAVIEEADVVEGHGAVEAKDQAEGVVFDDRSPAKPQPANQPATQPENQPENQPVIILSTISPPTSPKKAQKAARQAKQPEKQPENQPIEE